MIGTAPASPWASSDPKSASCSSARKNGSTSSHPQEGFPAAAQASKSSGVPRRATAPFTIDDPPTTLPRA
jgi:hypothetical protein